MNRGILLALLLALPAVAAERKVVTLAKRPGVEYTSEVRAWVDEKGVNRIVTTDRDDSGDVVTDYRFANGTLATAQQTIKHADGKGKTVRRVESEKEWRDAAAFFAKAVAAPRTDVVDIGGEVKRTTGTVTEVQNGDIACYLTLQDADGTVFTEMGDFPICFQKPSVVGKRVALAYKMANVLAASCQGDVNCGKSDRVPLVERARIVEAPRAGASAAPAAKGAPCAVVFSCPVGAKTLSLCAAPEGFTLTRPDGDPVTAKTATGTSVPFAGGGGAWMRIRSGSSAYVLYTGIGKWGPKGATREKAGLVVEKSGYATSDTRCTGRERSELGPDWFGKAGIDARGESFDFPE